MYNIDFKNFMSAVINKQSFDKISGYLKDIKDKKVPKTSILIGGKSWVDFFNSFKSVKHCIYYKQ